MEDGMSRRYQQRVKERQSYSSNQGTYTYCMYYYKLSTCTCQGLKSRARSVDRSHHNTPFYSWVFRFSCVCFSLFMFQQKNTQAKRAHTNYVDAGNGGRLGAFFQSCTFEIRAWIDNIELNENNHHYTQCVQ